MKKLKHFVQRFCHIRGLKYMVVALIAVVLIGFVDENSVWRHLSNRRQISQLQDEISRYKAMHEHDQRQIRELERNPQAIERIARERYFMKADDEDIFILSDDRPQETPQNQ